MKILLVAMPWHSLDTPSLALGILHERIKHSRDPHEVIDFYGSFKWGEYMAERSEGKLGAKDYTAIAEGGIFMGMGDWMFSAALYGQEQWRVDEYKAYLDKLSRWSDWLPKIQSWSPGFIARMVDEVVALNPDFVGFTSTFMQNVASLALARAIKERNPKIITAMGGANCDGPQGAALHRNFSFMDYIVRGEGEQAFVELLDALGGHVELKDIAGLCWRKDGRSIVNADRTHAFPAHQIPAPNYDAYFDAVAQTPLRVDFEPKLVMEGARGCWWGEKHHCTFCGLNGSMMNFRSKPPTQLWEEMRAIVERHQTLDILMVDNIIDLKYFKGLLPHISQSGLNLRIHYEVKSNLNSEQIQALKAAGVVNVQPGIENLSTHVLKLMAKGINGCHNVQTLRDCEDQGLTISWNYLYGFPGETPEDYTAVIEQLPALAHLQHPGGASRIALERFSPNFENPSLGFTDRIPALFYPIVYDLPQHELMDLAYIFETTFKGISGETAEALGKAVAQWRESYPKSELSYRDDGRFIYIRDRRANWPEKDLVMTDPLEVAVFRALMRPQAAATLAESMRTAGHTTSVEQMTQLLADWRKQGLVFEESGRFIALPLKARPQRIRAPAGKQRKSMARRPEGMPRPQGEDSLPQLSLERLSQGEPLGTDRLAVPLSLNEWDRLLPALEARGGNSAVAVQLTGELSAQWPSSQQLGQFAAQGLVEIRVPWEMEIGAQHPEESIHFVRFLRDCTSHRVRVQWKGQTANTLKPRTLLHLEPPVLPENAPEEALRTWDAEHSYGRFFWRLGQNFLTIKDMRQPRDASRFTLERGPVYELFTQLQAPHRLQDLSGHDREALDALLEEDLVLQLDDWFVALPYQIRHWPIPFATI
ncbi:RiPP maturation radical SAM C-methyltransferase [Hyalangium versicolor]|uniref:RiPP maturation radical SAM C-methyltransferase n=1 Tax=Hyalangium versicolor TaxID=2861190 RepID=UPI001CCC4C76|nr:RiPP maturation radical SAM C-methyltransferase [Hyalangium versicolor]